MVVCRGCYSQIHEIHPIHAFLMLPESKPSQPIDSSNTDTSGERCMSFLYPVFGSTDTCHSTTPRWPKMLSVSDNFPFCHIFAYTSCSCMMEIVGARFHCAICPSVDICSNCESAGLPGNLTSPDGGHDSSHIMIKVIYFLSENISYEFVSTRSLSLSLLQRLTLPVEKRFLYGPVAMLPIFNQDAVLIPMHRVALAMLIQSSAEIRLVLARV
jgi:hypothetical protein